MDSRNIWQLLCVIYILILYLSSTITNLEATRNKICFSNVTYREIKDIILDWWGNNDVKKPLKCKYNRGTSYEQTFFDMMSVPAAKTFPCVGKSDALHYHYNGLIKDGHLDGKGKLTFISDEEWSKIPHSAKQRKDSIALKNSNVCFQKAFYHGLRIKEVIGTFRNGSLYGQAKITYIDNAISIGHYRNGKADGFIRMFNTRNRLVDVGGFQMGLEVGFHWKQRYGHLLYQDRTMINDNISLTLVIPISDDGTLQYPIAGDYFPHSGALENIHKIKLLSGSLSKPNCIMELAYTLLERENYTYSLASKSKYPLFGEKGHRLLCNFSQNFDNNDTAKELENWFHSVKSMIQLKTNEDGFPVSSPLSILWKLRADLTDLNIDNSTRLISDINLNVVAKTITAKFFNGSPLSISLVSANTKLDKRLQLNGFNDIIITPKDQKLIPRDKALGWSPTRVIGKFDHGELNGFALLHTNASTAVWVTVKNGILHGPAVIAGMSYVIEPVSHL